MIITISDQTTSDERAQLMNMLCRLAGNLRPITSTEMRGREVVVVDMPALDEQSDTALRALPAVEKVVTPKTSYQLISRAFQAEDSSIVVGADRGMTPIVIGGASAEPVIMAGPCSVEGRENLLLTARMVAEAGATILRGGAFKPRTSPYQFQGLGIEGLKILAEAREEIGLAIVTEVMEPAMVDVVSEYADILQIGSRNMQNFALLRAVGQSNLKRPVMLKRGLSSTIEEWLLAAEYIVAAGNPNVMLCERGIRSFDQQTRNVLDLSCVPLLQEKTHLPIIVDPSHATGKRELVPAMSRASIAAGASGLIVEAHPDPEHALTDGRQSILPQQLHTIVREARMLAHMMRGEEALSQVA